MSDISIVCSHSDQREERTVSSGSKAWELFTDAPDVIAARVNGDLRDEGLQRRGVIYVPSRRSWGTPDRRPPASTRKHPIRL